jgi:hypothetical protein
MIKKKLIFPLFVIFMITMACTISYEGVAIGSDPDIEKIEDMTATAEYAQPSIPVQVEVVSTPEPAYQPVVPQPSEAETENAGPKEYSVTATNFDCTCQVDGNVTVEFNFKGDQLEIPKGGGEVDVYEKIGENTYKRSWMGYYILTSGSGDDATETKVDEERSAVIILNDDGYVMEHYQGSASTPCCFHTFTNAK